MWHQVITSIAKSPKVQAATGVLHTLASPIRLSLANSLLKRLLVCLAFSMHMQTPFP